MPETNEMSMVDLMDEWAELEPTKCEADTYDDPDGLGYFLLPQMEEGQSWVPKPVTSGWNQAEVQAAVQKAIRDAGCRWSRSRSGRIVIYESDGKTEHAAGSFPDPMDESEYSEACRLLAAWIDALRAHA